MPVVVVSSKYNNNNNNNNNNNSNNNNNNKRKLPPAGSDHSRIRITPGLLECLGRYAQEPPHCPDTPLRVNCRVWKSPSCPGVSPVVSG